MFSRSAKTLTVWSNEKKHTEICSLNSVNHVDQGRLSISWRGLCRTLISNRSFSWEIHLFQLILENILIISVITIAGRHWGRCVRIRKILHPQKAVASGWRHTLRYFLALAVQSVVNKANASNNQLSFQEVYQFKALNPRVLHGPKYNLLETCLFDLVIVTTPVRTME